VSEYLQGYNQRLKDSFKGEHRTKPALFFMHEAKQFKLLLFAIAERMLDDKQRKSHHCGHWFAK
jgi:hypothetical protein